MQSFYHHFTAVQKYQTDRKHIVTVSDTRWPLTSASSLSDLYCQLSPVQLFIPAGGYMCYIRWHARWVNTIPPAGLAGDRLHVTATRRLMQEQAGDGLRTILPGIPSCCCGGDGNRAGVLQQWALWNGTQCVLVCTCGHVCVQDLRSSVQLKELVLFRVSVCFVWPEANSVY